MEYWAERNDREKGEEDWSPDPKPSSQDLIPCKTGTARTAALLTGAARAAQLALHSSQEVTRSLRGLQNTGNVHAESAKERVEAGEATCCKPKAAGGASSLGCRLAQQQRQVPLSPPT